MVKQYIVVFLTLLVAAACNDLDAPDCLQAAGDTKTFLLETEEFSALEINNEFEVILQQGSEQKVQLNIGENLINDISANVEENTLIIADNNGCSWVRPLTFPKLLITTPSLIQVRQNGGGIIKSDGILGFNNLHLISEGKTGDFELSVNCDELTITNNNLSNYHITGTVNNLSVGFFAGDGRFEGADLQADFVNVFQRGTNDIIVFANKELTGSIISTGNLIYTKTKPEVLNVSLEGKGKLIFRK
ncbi:DUF2807 domain-containing protein [Fulvivirga sp. M361]|uniref:head GIN domain-containing protein n=1 Tax=Fulvivirga sp. M361 TaxID=2594266 RepID=UPI00117BD8AC|nr:head GIN domain-containing protein [Fulvivirga sp. M361]TRX54359.1 DUF2807 domain-containing protein [Fulvivirga sp. M361]